MNLQPFFNELGRRRYVHLPLVFLQKLDAEDAVALARILSLFHPCRSKRVKGRGKADGTVSISRSIESWAELCHVTPEEISETLRYLYEESLLCVSAPASGNVCIVPNYDVISAYFPSEEI